MAYVADLAKYLAGDVSYARYLAAGSFYVPNMNRIKMVDDLMWATNSQWYPDYKWTQNPDFETQNINDILDKNYGYFSSGGIPFTGFKEKFRDGMKGFEDFDQTYHFTAFLWFSQHTNSLAGWLWSYGCELKSLSNKGHIRLGKMGAKVADSFLENPGDWIRRNL